MTKNKHEPAHRAEAEVAGFTLAKLQEGDLFQTRNNLKEVVRAACLLQVLSKRYSYTPESASSDRISLKIDWGALNPEGVLGSTPKDFDQMDASSPGTMNSQWVTTIPMVNCKVTSEGEGLEWVVVKRIDRYRKETKLVVGLMNDNVEEDDFQKRNVGEAHFVQIKKEDHEEWEVRHRRVSDIYQGQGIGSAIHHWGEVFLEKRAKETKVPQILTAEVGQADVLVWFMKKGYVAATPEDQEKINRLFSGDPALIIVSGPQDENNGQKREWYIFEKEKLRSLGGVENPEIWKSENQGRPTSYTKNSFRIRLKKEIHLNQ